MKKIAFILIVALLSCQSETPKEEKIEHTSVHPMLGTWHTDVMIFDLNKGTADSKRDTFYSKDFAETMGLSKVEAIYNKDSTFSSAYYDTNDKALLMYEGFWYDKGDSLFVAYKPNGVMDTFGYLYSVEGNKGTFITMMTWDSIGVDNDYLELTSIKQ